MIRLSMPIPKPGGSMLPSKKSLLRKAAAAALMLLAAAAVLWLAVPKPKLLERYSYSSIVLDKNRRLMHIGLSMDEKYRLKTAYEAIPPEAVKALLLYEDRSFFYHLGINPLRTLIALAEMASGGRRQGASTVTMQLARMVFDIDSSTIAGKLEQMLRAVQIEMFYSKEQILEAYFNLAPYGMNIEGIGAAARVYFGVPPEELNLRQIMTLTVVPQNPSRRSLHTESGREEAEKAFLRLANVWKEFYGGEEKPESLPLYVGLNRPFAAPHLVRRLKEKYRGEIVSTIDLNLQKTLEDIISRYLKINEKTGIVNAAAMIVDRRNMAVLAKVGSADFFDVQIDGQVDGTRAYRSPGSVMKPFIFAQAMDMGLIHPRSMLKDVPRNFANYIPENYDRRFYGMIDATSALVKSRNVPAVDLLLAVGEEKYYRLLEKGGVKRLKSPAHYGLALALGGYELTMENVAEMYAALANGGVLHSLRFLENEPVSDGIQLFSAEAAFLTMDMLSRNFPVDRRYSVFSAGNDPYKVYWKTGTSFGYRDAWTAGIVGDYAVVVWLGNFDGEPNPALIGQEAAAPLFFKIVRSLAQNMGIRGDDISPRGLRLSEVEVCRPTGDIAGADCDDIIKSWFIPGVTTIKLSGISRRIPVDIKTGLRACRHRPPFTVMKSFEFWPSDVLSAYRAAGVAVKRPPAFGEDCALVETARSGKPPVILFPAEGSVLIIDLNAEKKEKLLLKASADADSSEIFWFYNGRLIGSSKAGEVFAAKLYPGRAEIGAVDDKGRSATVNVTVKPALNE